jgi:hypothetical protein
MMMFVALTSNNGRKVWVNAQTVKRVQPEANGAQGAVIVFGKEEFFTVQESPEDVIRKFQEGTSISSRGSTSSEPASPDDVCGTETR